MPLMTFAQGSLMLVGGGSEDYGDWSDLPYAWFVRQADSGIVINIDVDETAPWYAEYFKSFGADSRSRGLQIKDKTAANDSSTYKALAEAKGIFMEGGDQWDYVYVWKNTLVEEAIRRVYANGGVIGGTSAGLAVLGEVFFDAKFGSSYPEDAAVNCRNNDIHLDNGFLDLMPGVLTDSHFHPRGRIGRLVPMMAKWKIDTGEDLVGIGVDEKTAFCINARYQGIVYGKASVTIVKPTKESQCESIAGNPVNYTNLRFDQLVHGLEYDLNNFEVMNPERLNFYIHDNQVLNYTEITLRGDDDEILNAGSVAVNRLTSSATAAWYGSLTLSEGSSQVPNAVVINKIWSDDDYYENRFVGGMYAMAENPGITVIYLGASATLNIDTQGRAWVGKYAYFIDSRPMRYFGFPQKNDPSAPLPNSNHPAIINARLHFLKDGCEYYLNGDYPTKIGITGPVPINFEVGLAYPNPFNGNTQIGYAIHTTMAVSIKIYDMTGSEVLRYLANHSRTGRYNFAWNGIDQKGNSVPAGIYFLSFSKIGSGQGQVRKLTYVK